MDKGRRGGDYSYATDHSKGVEGRVPLLCEITKHEL